MTRRHTTIRLTRRAALGAGAASAVVAALGSGPRSAWAAPQSASASQLEPGRAAGGPGSWIPAPSCDRRRHPIVRRPVRKSMLSGR